MIVFAWFTIVTLVIIAGFTLVGLTLRHYYQESKALKAAARKAAQVAAE